MEPETIASTVSAAIRTATDGAKCSRVRVRSDAKRRGYKDFDRDMRAVVPRLREIFRGLCDGRLPWPLLLHGPTGTGKTSSVLCLQDWCVRAGYVIAERLRDIVFEPDHRLWTDWDDPDLDLRRAYWQATLGRKEI